MYKSILKMKTNYILRVSHNQETLTQRAT